ncbi:MAG: ComEC/Rec2 family competence protein [Candidatus Pacebacteria bacterium]|nr:ComEC/Rec2 family competence protein [Candidatus Paceibacterota bacterium]
MSEKNPKQFFQKYSRWLVLGVFLCANIFIWSAVLRADRHGELTVAFLDVGQGDSIYIEAPNGNQLLIDGSSGGQVLRALGKVMPFYDRSLDVILATHTDQDHIGGLPSVMERFKVDDVVTTENGSATDAYKAFENMISTKNSRRILARTGEKIILDRGITFEILFPSQNTKGWETNTSSIVARLTYGDESFLFTGDSPISIEKYLVSKDGAKLHSTVLKLGHHGSKTSNSREFLSAVDPSYAIISAGLNNKYGHPSKETLALLDELKIPHLSTIDSGSIIFKTDGTDISVE